MNKFVTSLFIMTFMIANFAKAEDSSLHTIPNLKFGVTLLGQNPGCSPFFVSLINQALNQVVDVVKSEEFRDFVLNYEAKPGIKKFSLNRGYSNEALYDLILGGAEIAAPTADQKMTITFSCDAKRSFPGATATLGTTKVVLHTGHFKAPAESELAGALFHEWLHLLGGFMHKDLSPAGGSVPYVLGKAVENFVDLKRFSTTEVVLDHTYSGVRTYKSSRGQKFDPKFRLTFENGILVSAAHGTTDSNSFDQYSHVDPIEYMFGTEKVYYVFDERNGVSGYLLNLHPLHSDCLGIAMPPFDGKAPDFGGSYICEFRETNDDSQ